MRSTRGIADITIVSVGSVKQRDLAGRIAHYARQIEHDARIAFVCVKEQEDREREGRRIAAELDARPGAVFALGEEGAQISSDDFARMIAAESGRPMVFLIGGHHGLSDSVKRSARRVLSLSRMTFTHEMAQMILVEQIYRAISILRGRPYHRGPLHTP